MLVTTKAVVLNRIKYADTSLIIKVYSQDFGIKTLIAKGVRKGKSNNQQTLFQSFNIIDVAFFQKENSPIGTLKTASHAISNTLIFDLSKSTIALFLSEVLLRYIKEEEKNEQLFSFLTKKIIDLINEKNTITVNNFTLYFIFSLTELLGIEPQRNFNDNHTFCLTEGCFLEMGRCKKPLEKARNILFQKFIDSIGTNKVEIPKQDRRVVLRTLLEYLDTQLSSFGKIRSLDVLEEIAL